MIEIVAEGDTFILHFAFFILHFYRAIGSINQDLKNKNGIPSNTESHFDCYKTGIYREVS